MIAKVKNEDKNVGTDETKLERLALSYKNS